MLSSLNSRDRRGLRGIRPNAKCTFKQPEYFQSRGPSPAAEQTLTLTRPSVPSFPTLLAAALFTATARRSTGVSTGQGAPCARLQDKREQGLGLGAVERLGSQSRGGTEKTRCLPPRIYSVPSLPPRIGGFNSQEVKDLSPN